MSYLLTEIALEMLGYKFYDTDGVYHLTNFQQTSPQTDLHPEEKTLRYYMEVGEDEDEQIRKTPSTQQSQRSQQFQQEPDVLQSSEALAAAGTGAPLKKRPWKYPKSIAKKVDIEYGKVRAEFVSRMEANIKKKVERSGAQQNLNELILDSLPDESIQLAQDAATLRKFRENVELELYAKSQKLYSRYVRIFGAGAPMDADK